MRPSRPDVELRERDQLRVLGLLELRVDRPTVRTAVGAAEPIVDPLDHLVGKGVAELVRMDVRFGRRVAHEVGEEALDDPVLADDALRALRALGSEDRLLLFAALDEPLGFQALEHLASRGTGNAEHLGDARGDRGRPGGRAILADRECQEVDRLEVLVDGVPGAVCHRASLDARLCMASLTQRV